MFAKQVDWNGVVSIIVVPSRQFRGRAPMGPVYLLVGVVERGVVLRVPPAKIEKACIHSKPWYVVISATPSPLILQVLHGLNLPVATKVL